MNQQPVSDNSISQNSEKSTGNAKKISAESKNFFDDIEGESGYIEDSGTIDELLPYKSSLSYENEADANADNRLNNVDDMLPVREDVNVHESAKRCGGDFSCIFKFVNKYFLHKGASYPWRKNLSSTSTTSRSSVKC